MIKIKTKEEIKLMKIAGRITYQTHEYLKDQIKVGITTLELDKLAEEFIKKHQALPSFKNYNGFPNTICTSLNDEVVHGIPSNYQLKEGDIISIDIGVNYQGYHGDMARTYPVGNINQEKKFLLKHTKEALYKGINQIKPGNKIGDISYAIEEYAKKHNLGVIKELVGHGVGNELHEEPEVPNYGLPNRGPLLKPGMVIAIEPMLNLGTSKICISEDGWTIKTLDGLPSAHFEHTVLVTEEGHKILTQEGLINGK
ncbi:MAG: type I methionyl aminopeptidase [Bacilli bacterium]|jgi:methionyl aminopeptidase